MATSAYPGTCLLKIMSLRDEFHIRLFSKILLSKKGGVVQIRFPTYFSNNIILSKHY
jgi:hypothetical protein